MVLSDPEWACPHRAELEAAIKEMGIERLSYIRHLFECEEFATALMTTARGRRATMAETGKLPREQWRNWPLGIVCGARFRGVDEDHWINICLTREGLYLIEPQTGDMWRPIAGEDEIYFLLM
jgi:hypothetical protein